MTDGDLISRQAVLDIFGDIHPLDYNARAYVAQIKELSSEKVDGDLISRDYVLSKFKEQCDRCGKYKENNGVMCNCCELDAAIDYVEDAPSAEKTDGDLISRQAAIDIVVFECGKWTGLAKEISKQLKQLPSADNTAEWVSKEGIFGAAYCSKCDYELHTDDTNYCPNCGANMRKEQQNEDSN